jgi:hypothetical protein
VGLNLNCDPQHERAVSAAVERALVTLLIVIAALCGGFLYACQILVYARGFVVMMTAVKAGAR